MKRKIIEIDDEKCTGCGQCVTGCAEGALAIIDGKARIVRDMFCDGLGACIGHCPEDALHIIEREADDFDEEAAMEHVRKMGGVGHPQHPAAGHGCPSAQVSTRTPGHGGCPSAGMMRMTPSQQANTGTGQVGSALSHWPIQIRLIPPHAPFLQDADLLIAGDCCPVATPDFHGRFLAGRTIMLGCPKFDNAGEYVERLAQVFAQNRINSVTILEMEVPCCSGLSGIVGQALVRSGRDIPAVRAIVARDGKVSEEKFIPQAMAPLGLTRL
ncbi:MAG: 4Fe-4S binding protein [Desulfomicrobium sp.]|nr:4Fe-4S binding protein [Desulfomicrobium sp.]MDP3429074.1 4Fe-4S binding protein [Desulfomicrobium sp.]